MEAQALPRFSTLAQISRFMRRNLDYTTGEQREQAALHGYRWKRPVETLHDGHGFCYDQAVTALALVEQAELGRGYLLLVRWGNWGRERNSGHVVCVVPQGNRLMVLDNGRLTGPWWPERALVHSIAAGRPAAVQRWNLEEVPFGLPYAAMS